MVSYGQHCSLDMARTLEQIQGTVSPSDSEFHDTWTTIRSKLEQSIPQGGKAIEDIQFLTRTINAY